VESCGADRKSSLKPTDFERDFRQGGGKREGPWDQTKGKKMLQKKVPILRGEKRPG